MIASMLSARIVGLFFPPLSASLYPTFINCEMLCFLATSYKLSSQTTCALNFVSSPSFNFGNLSYKYLLEINSSMLSPKNSSFSLLFIPFSCA